MCISAGRGIHAYIIKPKKGGLVEQGLKACGQEEGGPSKKGEGAALLLPCAGQMAGKSYWCHRTQALRPRLRPKLSAMLRFMPP